MRKYQKDPAPPRFLLRFSSNKTGFTLIELLVVITVIGVLAAIVLLAVNPGEQLARGRDTHRISAVTQLGRALQNYYTLAGSYPSITANGPNDWMQALVNSNDLKTKIGNLGYGSIAGMVNCATNNPQTEDVTNGTTGTNGVGMGYCYRKVTVGSPDAWVYVQLESERSKKKAGDCPDTTWAIYVTKLAKSGLWCSAGDPSGNIQIFEP